MTNVKNKPGESFNVHEDLYEDTANCTFLSYPDKRQSEEILMKLRRATACTCTQPQNQL